MKRVIIIFLALFSFSVCAHSQIRIDLEEAIIKVAADTGKSVVSISSVAKEKITSRFGQPSPFGESNDDSFHRFFEDFFGGSPDMEFKRMGLGSGVVIDKNGYILTNEHVVSGATEIKVKLSDGREFDAQVIGSDKRTDLAVIKINAANLPVAKFGDSDNARIGKWVVAIGNPFGFAIENPEPTVTVGVISALHRYIPALGKRERSYDELIQTDAAINPGNSGGPLVNLDGEVIGINTAIISLSGGYQGLGFAIPINKVKRVLDRLMKGQKVAYGWLGINIQDLNEDLRSYFGIKEATGIIVVKVYGDSPAERAGVKEGDLILVFDNQPVKASRDLIRMVSSYEVGAELPIKILREGKEITLKVKIGAGPKDLDKLEDSQGKKEHTTFRGLAVEDLTAMHKQRFRLKDEEGIIVTYIEENSPADKSTLSVGDLINKVNGKEVKNKEEFIAAVSKIKGSWLLKTNRGFVVVKEK
ncbi:MAG: Do family serine endopeptidase [Candidatus Omnitrophota bacterium]